MTTDVVAAPPRVTSRTWLVAGVLAVLVPPVVMGLATRSVPFALGYVPLLLVWAGIPQLCAWLLARTAAYRGLLRPARVGAVVLTWAVVGALAGAAVPYLTDDRPAGAAIGATIAVVLLSAANLVARAALDPTSRGLRVGVLGAVAVLVLVVLVAVVPYQW